MTMVAVTTQRDLAGAEVARELLAERGIPVEIKRLGHNPYFGAATAEEFEVRVPAERLDEAHELLDALSEELAQRALAEAGVPPDDDAERGSTGRFLARGRSGIADELPPPDKRPRKPSWAVALGLVGPVPGCGLLYARAFRLGWTFVGLSIALFIGGMAAGNADALVMVLALKAVDTVMAPFFAARFNRKLDEESHAAVA